LKLFKLALQLILRLLRGLPGVHPFYQWFSFFRLMIAADWNRLGSSKAIVAYRDLVAGNLSHRQL